MATSGVISYNPTVEQITSQALDLCGGDAKLASDAMRARSALQRVLVDLQNRDVVLWSMNMLTLDLSATSTYELSASTIDVAGAVLRTNVSSGQPLDISINRYGYTDYLTIPNKDLTSRPTSFYINRERDNPVLYVWPVPASGTSYQFMYWQIRHIENVGSPNNTLDVPSRFIPTLIYGTAWQLLLSREPNEQGMQKIQMMKGLYEETLAAAMSEDRIRSNIRIRARLR